MDQKLIFTDRKGDTHSSSIDPDLKSAALKLAFVTGEELERMADLASMVSPDF